MTAITQTTYNVTCKVCAVIAKGLKQLVRKIAYGMQMSANQRVARELVHLGFNQQKEMAQILQRMNDKTNEEYHGRY